MATEKRLIDANQMWKYAWNELQRANKRHKGEPDFKAWSSGVAEVIVALAKDMPTVDAVEVVRCNQCAYWERAKANKQGFLICPASGMEIMADDFCSYGERRTDGEH